MNRTLLSALLTAVGLLAPAPVVAQPDNGDTRLLAMPAVSADRIAFVYGDDLWVADRDGRNPRRLTSDIGVEMYPVFSPDGQTIAFTAQYDGNLDVYTIRATGGAPTRLTWHPAQDIVRGFTPDGKSILFSSPRAAANNRHSQLFTVPVEGGMPTQLPIPYATEASYSPDGKFIAYTPLRDATGQWKHYRGGSHGRIWIYNVATQDVAQIPQPESRCNDMDPNWVGSTIYFRSDRNGEYNVFSYSTGGSDVKQVTKFEDFPVVDIATDGKTLLFEQAGYLHSLNPGESQSKQLKITIAADNVESRTRYVKGAKYVRGGAISPSGARAVFEFRGEIVTVPAEKGDPRNLTQTTGVHERGPAWSPDGKSIAYFSDAGGEYKLHVRAADGKGDAKTYDLKGSGYYERATWSPDSKKIAFVDNSMSLFWIDLGSGKVTKVASEPHFGPWALWRLEPAWSPDSKWIAYNLGNRAAYRTVYVYNLESGVSSPLTDGLSDCVDPVFDASGKYLFLLSSTDAGPVNHWFAQSNADMRVRRGGYLVVLKKGIANPLAKESDEEKGESPMSPMPKGKKDDTGDKVGAADESAKQETKKGAKKEGKKDAVEVTIDFDGIDQRVVPLPIPAGEISNLQAGAAGQIYYLQAPATRGEGPQGGTLFRFDLAKRKSEQVTANVFDYTIAAGLRKALIASIAAPPPGPRAMPTRSWSIIDLGGAIVPPGPGAAAGAGGPRGALNLDAVEVKIDPRAEWKQIFDEAWRINRDFFYDPKMHGADWAAMKAKYEVFLPHVSSSGDLYRVIPWMLSELAVGHSYTRPGERLYDKDTVRGGLLGADYEIHDGRYRFKKVYGGLNWTPGLRAPLTGPGVEVKAGEYLLAVNGKDLKPPTEVYSLFEGTAGKSIEITVGPSADGKGSRTVTVEPIASEAQLRDMDRVEGNLKKVHAATNGRVAYVYVPNTAGPGHEYFKRYFYPQVDKDAIIVDERFNGGGQVADYYIDHLRRPYTAHWATRYGETFRTPGAAIFGPKVMLIDETAGSGGDLLPWMFREYKLGPLVGKRTWGGLVGILGFPTLMDGGQVTAPNLAFWTAKEGFGVENVGVPPDVDVEITPKDFAAGKDPQLEKAIDIVMEELKKNPPRKAEQPAFPHRVKP
jgi:tricorn protease